MRHEKSTRIGGRHKEEQYFMEKERELIEQLKQRAAMEEARKALAESVGVSDENILQTLQDMGYDRDVVSVLHLFPLVAVAWADGDVSDEERSKIAEAALAWGIVPDSAADKKLAEWLKTRPDAVTTEHTLRIIRDMMEYRDAGKKAEYRSSILRLSEEVANASRGILGFGRKISDRERDLLERIAREIAGNHSAAAEKILSNS